ncbi:hypothetical protein [Deinococcus altitudinis]|uniref:hypothetical protein n=1 Tax=Deinococcus altitudinis TaxID=468914 RepID=UPI0038925F3D
MRSQAALGLATALVLGLGACGQNDAPTTGGHLDTLGLVEVTVSGLDTARPQSVAHVLDLPPVGALNALALPEQVGGIDLQTVSTSVFNVGNRNAGTGRRYITATFKVRNADSNGTASAAARRNLTLIAVNVATAQDGSAVRAMQTFDGTAISTGVARGILPTHAMVFQPTTSAAVLSGGGEDLQVYSEAEVLPANFTRAGVPLASYADLGVNTVFPYGYVVRNPGAAAGAGRRNLPAAPATGQYDGRVAVSVVVPLQKDDPAKTPPEGAKRDPFVFNMVFVIVADPNTSVTQSLEEQGSNAPVNARITDTAATGLNVLPGSSVPAGVSGGVTTRRVCQVRTAGLATDVSPAPTYLVNICP